jgi:hypothetical protein
MISKDIKIKFNEALTRALASVDLPSDYYNQLEENVETKNGLTNQDRETLFKYQQHLQNILPNTLAADIEGDRIVIHFVGSTTEPDDDKIDYTPYMRAIMEYMVVKGMNVEPFPAINIREDLIEASWVFGKTAYYDPIKKEVTLYTAGRHGKDILRSLAHEMIHHMQNLEGRIGNDINTTNVNESDRLKEIEKEAYLEGNIVFREWTDSVTKK